MASKRIKIIPIAAAAIVVGTILYRHINISKVADEVRLRQVILLLLSCSIVVIHLTDVAAIDTRIPSEYTIEFESLYRRRHHSNRTKAEVMTTIIERAIDYDSCTISRL